MKKFLYAHYEKIILALLLVIFAALLYYQLLFVQKAQTQDVAAKVNPVQKPSDYKPVDFSAGKFQDKTVFSAWNEVKPAHEESDTATTMMTPYPLAECVYCHTLIPASKYPPPAAKDGETPQADGECPACHKPLKPRQIVDDGDLGEADQNDNGILDEWEKKFQISSDFIASDSDQDQDGFTLLQEYKADTDPTDPKSHPKYITQIFVDAIARQKFNDLQLISVDRTKKDKTEWEAEFNVIRNEKKRTEYVKIDAGFNHQNLTKNRNGRVTARKDISFKLIDIVMDEAAQQPVAYIQRVGKPEERIPCNIQQDVYDPELRVRFINTLGNTTFVVSVGGQFKLGTEQSGEELYKLVSANPNTKEVVVENMGEPPTDGTPETITIPAAVKSDEDKAKPASSGTGTSPSASDSASFISSN